jgi:hypothetical protein
MIALAWLVAPSTRAHAQSVTAAAPPRYDHGQQLGLSVMPGVGYRMIVRYNEDQTCLDADGPDSKAICTNSVPVFLDFQLSFGITSGIDLLTDVRLGLAREEAAGVGRQLTFAPGLRIWLDRDRPLKIFTTLQLVHDRTTQSQAAVSNTDWGIRNANGLMYDPIRNFGVFFQLGETIAFMRWFRIEIDVGMGVQVRLP